MLAAAVLLLVLLMALAIGFLFGYSLSHYHWEKPEVAGAILQHLYARAQVKWIKSDRENRQHCPVCGWNEGRGEWARVAEAREDAEQRQKRSW